MIGIAYFLYLKGGMKCLKRMGITLVNIINTYINLGGPLGGVSGTSSGEETSGKTHD